MPNNSHPKGKAAIARFVERFALLLTEAGMPRMPARVFASLLAVNDGRRTAAELAEALHVSPAAISGAVRYLNQVGLVVKGREPGERRDHYQVVDSVWYDVYFNRQKMFQLWLGVIADGIDAVGSGTPAGQRLDKTRRFFEFLRHELPALIERWQAEEATS